MSRRKHEELQKRICILCLKETEKPITQRSKELIVKYVYSDFHQNEDYLPKSLCEHCRLTLSKGKPLVNTPDCKKLVLNVKDNQR